MINKAGVNSAYIFIFNHMSILLRKLIREIILEQLEEVTLKVPKEQAQKDELMTLMSLLSKKMPGSEESLESAKAEIAKGNWNEALELIKMYFIMKKIPIAIEKPKYKPTKI